MVAFGPATFMSAPEETHQLVRAVSHTATKRPKVTLCKEFSPFERPFPDPQQAVGERSLKGCSVPTSDICPGRGCGTATSRMCDPHCSTINPNFIAWHRREKCQRPSIADGQNASNPLRRERPPHCRRHALPASARPKWIRRSLGSRICCSLSSDFFIKRSPSD
jgi:hypothetical protein